MTTALGLIENTLAARSPFGAKAMASYDELVDRLPLEDRKMVWNALLSSVRSDDLLDDIEPALAELRRAYVQRERTIFTAELIEVGEIAATMAALYHALGNSDQARSWATIADCRFREAQVRGLGSEEVFTTFCRVHERIAGQPTLRTRPAGANPLHAESPRRRRWNPASWVGTTSERYDTWVRLAAPLLAGHSHT